MSPSMLSTPDDTSANWLPMASGEMPCSKLAILCWSNLTLTRIPSTMTCTPMLVCTVGIGCSISRCFLSCQPSDYFAPGSSRHQRLSTQAGGKDRPLHMHQSLHAAGSVRTYVHSSYCSASKPSVSSKTGSQCSPPYCLGTIVCTHVKWLCQLNKATSKDQQLSTLPSFSGGLPDSSRPQSGNTSSSLPASDRGVSAHHSCRLHSQILPSC